MTSLASTFDLTSAAGLASALKFHKNNTALLAVLAPLLPVLGGPVGIVAGILGTTLARTLNNYTPAPLVDPPTRHEQQAATASELLKNGKDLGLSKMEIILDQTAGIEVKAGIKVLKYGGDVTFNNKNHTKMTIRVTY